MIHKIYLDIFNIKYQWKRIQIFVCPKNIFTSDYQNKHGRLLMEKFSFANCGSCFGGLLTLYNCQNRYYRSLKIFKSLGWQDLCERSRPYFVQIRFVSCRGIMRRLLLVCQGHRHSLSINWKPSAKNRYKYPLQGDILSLASHSSCWKW